MGCIPVHKRVQAPMVPEFKQPPGLRPGLPGFGPGLAAAFGAFFISAPAAPLFSICAHRAPPQPSARRAVKPKNPPAIRPVNLKNPVKAARRFQITSPVSSGIPSMRFMHSMAAPDAPLPRLSKVEMTRTRSSLPAIWMVRLSFPAFSLAERKRPFVSSRDRGER